MTTKTTRAPSFKYMINANTWLAHAIMKANLETLKNGHYPNGEKLTRSDIAKISENNRNCIDILTQHDCDIPIMEDKPGDQFKLF